MAQLSLRRAKYREAYQLQPFQRFAVNAAAAPNLLFIQTRMHETALSGYTRFRVILTSPSISISAVEYSCVTTRTNETCPLTWGPKRIGTSINQRGNDFRQDGCRSFGRSPSGV